MLTPRRMCVNEVSIVRRMFVEIVYNRTWRHALESSQWKRRVVCVSMECRLFAEFLSNLAEDEEEESHVWKVDPRNGSGRMTR